MEPEICFIQNKRERVFRSGWKTGHAHGYTSQSAGTEQVRSQAERGVGGKPKIPGGLPWGAQQ